MSAFLPKNWFILKPHLTVWLTGWLAGALLLALQGYHQSFLTLNRLHLPALDRLMPHLTHLGDGVLPVAVFALLVIHRNRGLVLAVVVALLVGTVLNTALKEYFFWPRPPLVFDPAQFHYITVQQEKFLSFPSGHSLASAITGVFCVLSFPRLRRWWSVFTALTAMAIAYTRIYIGVHFLGDVLAGSALGLLIATALMGPLTAWLHKHTDQGKPTLKWTVSGILYVAALATIYTDITRLARFY